MHLYYFVVHTSDGDLIFVEEVSPETYYDVRSKLRSLYPFATMSAGKII